MSPTFDHRPSVRLEPCRDTMSSGVLGRFGNLVWMNGQCFAELWIRGTALLNISKRDAFLE